MVQGCYCKGSPASFYGVGKDQKGNTMSDAILNGLFVAYNLAIGVCLIAIAWKELK